MDKILRIKHSCYQFFQLLAVICYCIDHVHCQNVSVVLTQLPSTTACYTDFFDDILCPPQVGVIEIEEALYAASNCASNPSTQCCPFDFDCDIIVSLSNPDYFSSIQQACNGKYVCEHLQAKRTSSLGQCGVQFTDYVRIYYKCISDSDVTTANTQTTDASNGGLPPTKPPDSSNPLAWAIPVGIILGLALVLIPLGLVYYQRYRQNSKGTNEKEMISKSLNSNGSLNFPGEVNSMKRQDSTDCYGDSIYDTIDVVDIHPTVSTTSSPHASAPLSRDFYDIPGQRNLNENMTLGKPEPPVRGVSAKPEQTPINIGITHTNYSSHNASPLGSIEYEHGRPSSRKLSEPNIYVNTPTMKRHESGESQDASVKEHNQLSLTQQYSKDSVFESSPKKETQASVYIDVLPDEATGNVNKPDSVYDNIH